MSYRLQLTKDEENALAWCAARYESARILFEGMEEGSGPFEWIVPEHVAWNARDAIAEDGGDPWPMGFIPCLDSPAIRELFDRIV